MSALRPQREEIPPEAEALLDQRAQRAEQRASLKDERALEEQSWVAEFALGDGQFAFPLEALRAVLPLRRVTPAPLSQSHVVGMTRYQGEILTVLSMGALVQARGWRRDPSVLLVLTLGSGRLVGLDCEEVPKASAIPTRLFQRARDRQGVSRELITADLRMVQLLDLDALLARAGEADRGR